MALQAKLDRDFGSCIGTIGYVSIKELTQVDQYENTHRASFTVQGANKSGDPKAEKDSIFFAAGSIKGGKLTAKDSEGNWVEVVKGCDVKFQFQENGDWFNVKRSQLTVTKVVAAQAAPAEGEAKAPFNKEGMEAGHIENCTENFLGAAALSDGDLYKKTLADFQKLTNTARAKFKEVNPSAREFDIGMGAGRAVLSASRNAGSDFASVEAYTINVIVANTHELALAVVRGGKTQAPAPKPQAQEQKPIPKETQAKINPQEPVIDFDDDIPF